ncbi:MAG TPA: hypothetical protein V6D08_14845 [Candidatus Obscuribacterales bacterium]
MGKTSSLRTIGEKYKNPLARLLMAVVAVLVMVPYEFAEYLCGKAYKGWTGALRAVLGFGLGIAGGIGAAHYVGWTLDRPIFLWLLAGFAGFVAVTFYAWPITYLILIKPAWTLAEKIWDGIRDLARNHFKNLTQRFINLLTSVFPLAGKAWSVINGRTSESWLDTLLVGLSYVTTVLGSGYLGWSIFRSLSAFLAASWGFPTLAAAAAAGFVGFLGFAFVVGVLAQLLKYGKIQFVAIGTGASVVYGAAAATSALITATFGPSAAANWAAYVIEFLLYTAYVFPVANVLLTDGLKWFVETVKPLVEKVYDGEEKTYRQFFHSLVNLAVAALVFILTLQLGPMLALPVWGGYLLAGAAALLSYILVFKAIDMDGGNIILGILATGAVAWRVFVAYWGAAWIFGVYGAIGAAVVAAAFTFLLGFPLLYIAFRSLTNRLLASWLSKHLVAVHSFVYEQFKKVMGEVGHCYEYGYRDKTDRQKNYREMFLHLVNIATTCGAYFGAVAGAEALGFATIATVISVAAAVVLSYLLAGKLILKAGTELVGVVVSLAASFYVGAMVHAAGVATWLAVGVGIVALPVTFFIAFPIAYILVRLVGQPLLAGWLSGLLAGIYNWCWARFVDLWEQFLAVYRAIRDFVRPYWQALVRTWSAIWRSIKDTWDSIRGRKG